MGNFNKWDHLVLKGEFAEREKLLSGLTLDQVTRKPAPQLHSIYDELWHTVRWQHIVINNDTELEKNWYAGEVFPSRQAESQEEWDGLVKEFMSGLNKIIEFTKTPGALSAEADQGATVEDYLYALIMHNTYHLGKIVALRQMIGSWPPAEV